MFAAGLTSYAHPLGLAAMDGVLDLLQDPAFLGPVRALEQAFLAEMRELAAGPEFQALRCHGLLAALDFAGPGRWKWQDFAAAGVHLFANDKRLVLAPPMVMAVDELKACCASIRRVLGRPE